jgi:D-glycero-D-manno-heptose 1,7-bisphosphate phosphatase
VPAALRALEAGGFRLIVVTNQPDVGAGRQTRAVVERMHERLRDELPLHDIRVCYHVDEANCDCRKPRAGLLLAAAREWDIDLGRSYMVGDRWRDIGAGRAAGCVTIFIDRGYAEGLAQPPDFVCGDLAEAAAIILARTADHAGTKGGR